MAFSLNKIMLIGNLGNDAENRFTGDNLSVTTFSIATTNSFKDKEGNWKNETTWHNIVSFNLSDYFKNALKKGAKFYVEGRLTKRDYTDKENIKRYVTEVVAEKLIPLDGRDSGNYEQNSNSSPSSNNNSVSDTQEKEDDLPF